MYELPETWLTLLRAIIAAPNAWPTPSQLAQDLGWELSATVDLLADLDVAGWVVVWDRDEGPSVTLTSLAAERLGVHLVETGPEEEPRWWPVGDPEPPAPRAKNVCAKEDSAQLDFVVDPTPGPQDLAIAAEARSVPQVGVRGAWPRPKVLVGSGLIPWPGPRENADHVCPACGDQPLPPNAYCLRCDRWGLDQALSAALELDDEGPPADHALQGARTLAAERRSRNVLRTRMSDRKDRLRERLATQEAERKARQREERAVGDTSWRREPPRSRAEFFADWFARAAR